MVDAITAVEEQYALCGEVEQYVGRWSKMLCSNMQCLKRSIQCPDLIYTTIMTIMIVVYFNGVVVEDKKVAYYVGAKTKSHALKSIYTYFL